MDPARATPAACDPATVLDYVFPGRFTDLGRSNVTAVVGAESREPERHRQSTANPRGLRCKPRAWLLRGSGARLDVGPEFESDARFDGHVQLGWELLFAST